MGHLFPIPPFFLGLILLLIFSTSSTPASLLSPAGGLSHRKQSSMSLSNLSPSRRQQFVTNCSSVNPFHWGTVLQKHTPPAWVPASKPAPVWTAFSMGPQVLPGPALSQASHSGTSSFRHPFAPCGALQGLQVNICSTTCQQGLRGQPVSPWSFKSQLNSDLTIV